MCCTKYYSRILFWWVVFSFSHPVQVLGISPLKLASSRAACLPNLSPKNSAVLSLLDESHFSDVNKAEINNLSEIAVKTSRNTIISWILCINSQCSRVAVWLSWPLLQCPGPCGHTSLLAQWAWEAQGGCSQRVSHKHFTACHHLKILGNLVRLTCSCSFQRWWNGVAQNLFTCEIVSACPAG